jgi:antitoxin VapB
VKNPRKRSKKTRYKAVRPSRPLSVAEPAAPAYGATSAVARVFQSGNSQAVRLPKEFRVQADELQIFRRGDDIILREKPLKLSELLTTTPPLPDDFPDDIPDRAPEPVEDE